MQIHQNLDIAKFGISGIVPQQLKVGGYLNLIGQFGVGFYSVYLVVNYVEVISKHNDGKQYGFLYCASIFHYFYTYNEPLGRGTEIRLHLKEETGEYLEESKPKELVKRLSLAHDNEDMLLPLVQKKLSNLERDIIFDFGVALREFTRRIVILRRVKDLQLGVKRYQKKLNITKPKTFRSVLHDNASNLRMDYFPKRRWSNLDSQRSRIMFKAIDKLMLERRLMGSLEKFIGGRDYGEDFRLLEQTI
ncbi:uncharacterized mitochondrial protein-like protein [Tanacetum coccineum]